MQDSLNNAKQNLLKFFSEATADTVLRIVGAVAMLLIGLFVIKHMMRILDRSMEKSKMDQGILSFLGSLISITLRSILIIMVASSLGVPSTSFIAILSSIGLAIGLALQGSLGNFAGGLMLLWFHPFRVGDYIKNDMVEGTVVSMNIMYTQLATFDKKKVIVPNSALSNGVVTNFSAFDSRRVDLSFQLAYDSDVNAVKALMVGIANRHPLVLETPASEARLASVQNGLLNFTLRCWCRTPDFWTVTFDLTEGLKQAFDRGGFRLPPPQSQVRMTADPRGMAELESGA